MAAGRQKRWMGGVTFVAALTACGAPDDTLFDREPPPPVDVGQGVLRVTFNEGPDVVRGFTADGETVYLAREPNGPWRLVRQHLTGGFRREEAGVYRAALRDSVAGYAASADARLLTVWRRADPDLVGCVGADPVACPALPFVLGVTVFRLPLADGPALSAVPSRTVVIPNFTDLADSIPPGAPITRQHRLRDTPADAELAARRVDPYAPALGPDAVYLSDGEDVWRFPPDLAQAARLGPGAFAAVSPDGALVAAAVPVGLDSTGSMCSVAVGIGLCVQETITIRASGWSVILYDLAADAVRLLGEGLEPRFHPDGTRLLVRRNDGLHWLDLATGNATAVPGTSGAYAAQVAPDGSLIAFSMDLFGQADVFFRLLASE